MNCRCVHFLTQEWSRSPAELLILDVALQGKKSLEILEEIKKVRPDIDIIFMSSILYDDSRVVEVFKMDILF